jgi:CubicO group peptidase (beta-lactamase class C family)
MKHIKTIKVRGFLFGIIGVLLIVFASFKSACNDQRLKAESVSLAPEIQDLNKYEQALQQINLKEHMEHFGVPGVSIAIIKNGKLDWAKGYGKIQRGDLVDINLETMFSVGSISKVGAATVTLRLVQMGKLNLKTNVNDYLDRWKVKENRYTQKEPVSLQRIMSHTAGLTVHGFADFLPSEDLPSLVEILNGTGNAKNGAVYVNVPVGSQYRYSGGGTMVEQLVIEEVTKKRFNQAAIDLVFDPLNMNRSSYLNPLPKSFGNIAMAHDRNGKPVALPRGYHAMPEAAASGLWTTPVDFSKLMIALMESFKEGKDDFLSQELVKKQMTPVAPGKYGLGPRIETAGQSIIFSHGGANDSYKALFIGYMANKNGIIVFTNGSRGDQLIDEIIPTLKQTLKL